jgi:parallel beta-helix repeat protein
MASPRLVTGALAVGAVLFLVIVMSSLFTGRTVTDPTLAPTTRPAGVVESMAVAQAPGARTIEVTDADPEGPDRSSVGGTPVLAASALFVDASAGSSSNPGTIDQPFQRPNDAFNVVEPGTTIYLRAGVYDDRELGSNVLRRSGTADAWINIEPYPGERVEIRAGGEWGNGFALKGAAYVRVADFVIIGHEDSIHGSGVFAKDGSHDIAVEGNYIEGFGGAGVSFVRSSRVTIENNEIRDNAHRSFYQSSGISLFEAEGPINGVPIPRPDDVSGAVPDFDQVPFDNVIRNNYVIGNYNGVPALDGRITDGNCVIIDWFNPVGYQGTTLVENNVCVENGGRGVHVFSASNVLARNNTMVGNSRTLNLTGSRVEMTAVDGTNIQYYNNLVLNGDGVAAYQQRDADDAIFRNNYVASGPPPGEGNIELNADPTDILVSLSGSSPLEDLRPVENSVVTGTAGQSYQPRFDAVGVLRPEAGAVGALEPVPVGTVTLNAG